MAPAEPAEGGRGALLEAAASAHLAAIVEYSDDAIMSKDPSARITSWNPAAERMYGYTVEEALGRPIEMLVPGHRAGEEMRILDRILGGERVDHYETERLTKDGRTIMVSLTVSPIRELDGSIVGASVIARDVTLKYRSRELASRLQEVTLALSRELAPDRVVEVMLEQAVPALGAAAGAVALVEGDELVLAGAAGHSAAGLSGWGRFPLAADVPIAHAVNSGEPIWTSSSAELAERFSGLVGARIRFSSLAALPLAAGGRPFGAISLSFEQERDFDLEERAFLAAATQQAAYALRRAWTYEAERLAAERQRFLAESGELLAQSLDPDATLTQLANLAVRHIADWCGIELLDEAGGLRNVAVAHTDPERVELAHRLRERYPVDPNASTGAPNVIRTGASELHSEIPDQLLVEAAIDEDHLRMLRELGLHSAMVVPLRARGRVFGAITLVASDPSRRYDESDLGLAEDLARRAALAVDNAMLYRREHEAALVLQRSLLPQSLPRIPGLEFDACYKPAGADLEVGGDWYEVVAVDDGTVAVTIGDVAGRGIRAASVMGRVRLALRAYVLDGHRPHEAVQRLDRLMKEFGRFEMTTVFHLHYDPARGTARYVRAGHLPALLRRPGGEVVELSGGGTPPLGILNDIEIREHELELPADSLLLLYTDGLIERRDRDLADGLGQLKGAFAEAPSGPCECLDWLAAQLSTDAGPDDVAMLAMSTGQPGSRSVEALSSRQRSSSSS